VNTPFAIDTNIAIYAFSSGDKRIVAMELIQAAPKISIQLLNEFTSVSFRKRKASWPEIEEALDIISNLCASTRPLGYDVHDLGRLVAQRYELNFYDALMIAAALLDKCKILYSEDMQHGLVIDRQLTIINPFNSTD
jgi:predicted nucleic acid-binding protein